MVLLLIVETGRFLATGGFKKIINIKRSGE